MGKKIKQEKNPQAMSKKNTNNWYLFSLVFIVGIFFGWIAKSNSYPVLDIGQKLDTIRLKGYKFISPLLLCNNDQKSQTIEFYSLQDKLQKIVNQKIKNKDIVTASVYIRDYKNNNQLIINENEKFSPASLNKIPVMMAYYKMAEGNVEILKARLLIKDQPNPNDLQEIKPLQSPKPGSSYTVDELITYLIRYSDNYSYNALIQNIDPKKLEATYEDLKISIPADGSPQGLDFITTNDFSYFLRVLYNATYLNRDYSEKALKILSEVNYKNGIVSSVKPTDLVSHKFGLYSYANDGKVIARELHDCGIIYSKKTYLICVMTKSISEIPKIEKTIQEISAVVYDEMNK